MSVADSQMLFAAHRAGVQRYLSRMIGPREATDLTQEVFLRVARSPVPEATAAGQRAWVFRIARNLAINHRRDALRRPATVELGDACKSPSQEIALAVRQAIERLAPVDRDVFLLREAAGLSYGEIASACELTGDAVRCRLHRARQQLRAALSPPHAAEVQVSLPVRSYDEP